MFQSREMRPVLLLLLCFAAANAGLVTTVKIDLDRRPFDRWREVGKRYGPEIQSLITVAFNDFFPKYIHDSIGLISRQLERYMPQPYLDEVKGLSQHGNITLSGLVFMQLIYEATAFCTSIVCVTDSGVVWHARNLDYGRTGQEITLLNHLVVNMDFVRGGRSVYKGTSFAGLVGLPTGIRANAFSITLNERNKGSIVSNLFSLIVEVFASGKFSAVFTGIRTTLNDVPDFNAAVSQLATKRLIAPCYLTVGGVRGDEGVVITRDQRKALDIQRLNATSGRWFLLQTNYDNWVTPPPDDDRRDPGDRAMKAMSRGGISMKNLFRVLWTCLLYTSPSPRDLSTSRMPSSA